MFVKNVIIGALNLLDMQDLAQKLEEESTLDSQEENVLKLLMHCYNAVEDEVARLYFPLTDEYSLKVSGGEIIYANFPKTPVKILSVKSEQKAVKYRLLPTKLKTVNANVVITYNYSPQAKALNDNAEVAQAVSERLLYYGVVAEYCLICGLLQNADAWESKYREEVCALKSAMQTAKSIPQRSWV